MGISEEDKNETRGGELEELHRHFAEGQWKTELGTFAQKTHQEIDNFFEAMRNSLSMKLQVIADGGKIILRMMHSIKEDMSIAKTDLRGVKSNLRIQ